MSSLDPEDPQVYLDGERKLRRRPGRPRIDPRGTQAQIRAIEAAERRKKLQQEADLTAHNRQQVTVYAMSLITENRVMLQDLLVGMVEHAVEVCMSADLGLTSEQVRAEASRTMTAELGKLISPAGIADYQSAKLRALLASQQPQLLMATIPAPTPPLPVTQSLPELDNEEPDIKALMEAGLPCIEDD